ncbi:FAD-dependent oxidoreductase [Halostagnicola kamekurae]|uniref:2-polyprenyl-6-methoxyphenol hydroxylase n=1 Tax=Halostagnicola kamekurae TaxID=619731 RepID=A0A1I6TR27_9EURY|nr:FAD-dependent monooxygenase [Halostagnicola kamekurae]SFS91679.1 2-polyprenyl-6-methoxyphenol hydroxylase [Halostagnicola kamekurae]
MAQETPEVAIIGGGICGLTTALAFEQRGWTPTVYEAASGYRPIGAGLLLQTNALLVFNRLGIAERIRTAGVPLSDSLIRSSSGRVLTRFDLDQVERSQFGYGFVAIHRAELQRILLEELDTEVHTGMTCEAVATADPPAARFTDGTQIQPDILIGADGINSAVRDAIAADIELQALESIVYRAVSTVDLPDDYRTQGVEVWGNGTYTGGAPIDTDRFYWFATAPGPTPSDSTTPAETIATLRDRYTDYPEPIPTVVDSLDPDDVFVTGLEDVPALETWSRGSVVIAGDAAHGMLPFAGQGAAQAIEDALALVHALDTHDDPAIAFDAFEAERKPRADRIRSESHRLGTFGTMQSRVGTRARNLVVKLLPDTVFRRSRRRRAAQTSLPEEI